MNAKWESIDKNNKNNFNLAFYLFIYLLVKSLQRDLWLSKKWKKKKEKKNN